MSVEARRIRAPHVASVDPPTGRIEEDAGMDRETSRLGHRQHIESSPTVAPVRSEAGPLSAFGQRRRIARLAGLAECLARPSGG